MNKPKEGEIFKTVSIGGATFTIKYGYYEDYEREQGEPIPIYPDLKKEPAYADDGRLIVTQMQDTCKYSNVKTKDSFCVECKHFRYGDDLIGFCNHRKNKKIPRETTNIMILRRLFLFGPPLPPFSELPPCPG